MMKESLFPFSQINAFAMQNGVILGIWVLLSQFAMVGSFTYDLLSLVSALMMLFSPILLFILTKFYRNSVAPVGFFTVTQGFLNAFLTSVYASVWVSLLVYVYLTFFDNGYVFDAYIEYFNRPEVKEVLSQNEMQQQLNASLQGMTLEEVIEGLRFIPPVTYAMMIFYLNLIVSPIASLCIALFLKRVK